MRVLLDEDTPAQLIAPLVHVLVGHEIKGIHEIGWGGKKDPDVLRDAKRARNLTCSSLTTKVSSTTLTYAMR
jgi:hypothetical protein